MPHTQIDNHRHLAANPRPIRAAHRLKAPFAHSGDNFFIYFRFRRLHYFRIQDSALGVNGDG